MKEVGIDLSQRKPRSVQEFLDDSFDYVIAVGDCAGSDSTKFRQGEWLHWNFANPIEQSPDPERQIRAFRMIRDQIAQRLHLFVLVLAGPHAVRSAESMNQAQDQGRRFSVATTAQ